MAAVLDYEIDRTEIERRLFLDTGRETKIIIAEQTSGGAIVARPIVEAVVARIKTNKIGLMIIDPFVASHRVVENDNPSIELVASPWAARLRRCAGASIAGAGGGDRPDGALGELFGIREEGLAKAVGLAAGKWE